MKINKVIIAALLVAALMVIPAAVFTSDDDSSADPEPQTDIASMFTGLMGLDLSNIDLLEMVSKLPGAVQYNEVPKGTEHITGDTSVAFNDVLILNSDIIYDGDYCITMNGGSAVVMCVGQDFSISTGDFTGRITFKPESQLFIVTDLTDIHHVDQIPPEKTVYAHTFHDSAQTYSLKGKIDYKMQVSLTGIDAALTATKGSVIGPIGIPSAEPGTVRFSEDNVISAKMDIKMSEDMKTMSVSNGIVRIVADLAVMDKDKEMATLKGSGEYTVNATIPVGIGTLTASAKGDLSFTFSYNGYDATLKNSVDVNATVQNYNDDTKDPVTDVEGSISFSLNYGKMKIEEKEGVVEISGLNISADTKFTNNELKLSAKGGLDSYTMTPKDGLESYIRNADFSLDYAAEIDIKKSSPVAALDPAALISGPSPSDIVAALLKEYLDGVKKGLGDRTIQEYASSFFLAKLDAAMKLDKADLKSKSIGASFSVGEVRMYGSTATEMKNLRLTADINDSVGVSVSFKVDKMNYTDSKTGTKYMLQPANVSLKTYTGEDREDYVFTIDFSLTGEIKRYDKGKLIMDPFINGLSGTVNIGARETAVITVIKTQVAKLTASEITMNSYGIDMSAKNVKFDTDKSAFSADRIEISGYYTGGNTLEKYGLVKEVTGTYSKVQFMIGTSNGVPCFSDVLVDSLDVKYTDIYDNTLSVKRSYSENDGAISNDLEAKGQFWLYNVLNDDLLNGIAFSDTIKFSGVPDTVAVVKNNYVFKGTIIVDREYYMTGIEGFSNVTYSDKMISITYDDTAGSKKLSGGFVGDVYIINGNMERDGYPVNAFTVGSNRYVLNTVMGGIIGFSADENGDVTYKIIALNGFNLVQDPDMKGFKMGEIKDNEAPVTEIQTGIAIKYYAQAVNYKISIDGEVKVSDATYRTYQKIAGIPDDAIMFVDENGMEWGYINSDRELVFSPYDYAGDLNLTSVRAKEFKDVQIGADKLNETSDSNVFFKADGTWDTINFKMGTGVRFSIDHQDVYSDICLIAQETKFNGKNAYLIRASAGDVALKSTLLIPASEGDRIIHVDEYGRAAEMSSVPVKIGNETFLKIENISDYSIFYKETDSPRYSTGGSDNTLLYIAIGVAVAAVAAAGVIIFIRKH